jgi:UDP-glucose 4-epimerase
MTVLITGGTGFIGAYLTRAFVAHGEPVVDYDLYPNRGRVAEVDGVTVVAGDILDAGQLLATMDRFEVDRVVHLAGVPGSVIPDRTVDYTTIMCTGTANVFDAARRHGIRRVVNASSVAAYGLASKGLPPADEDEAGLPTDLYGACKLWSEGLARVQNDVNGMEILSLRICSALGEGRLGRASLDAGLTDERITPMAAPELVALGRAVSVPGDDELYDFAYAPDVAEAFRLAAVAPRPEHSVFNLASYRHPYGDVTRRLLRRFPEARIEKNASASPTALGMRLMETGRLRAELGYDPVWTLEAAVDDYVDRVQRREELGAGRS